MLYKIAHLLRDRFPFIWDFFDIINSYLFSFLYRKRLKALPNLLKEKYVDYTVCPIKTIDTNELVDFFANQPDEAFQFFKPHGFDADSLMKLKKNDAFLAYVIKDNGKIVSYFFLRTFFWGKSFIGRMVDYESRGKGLAKLMNRMALDIVTLLQIRLYRTISPKNVASLKSAQSEFQIRIIKTMKNGDLFIESIPKNK